MVVILKKHVPKDQVENIKAMLKKYNVRLNISEDKENIVLGLLGDTSKVNKDEIKANEYVDKIIIVKEPYKKASRLFHPLDSIISIKDREIGNKKIAIIAGPCSVESESQVCTIAREVKKSGASFLRGGAFKPRTSPYSFQGLGLDGLEILKIAREETGLPIVTEIMSTKYLDKFIEEVDVIQIGARNMQNFELLKEVGKTKKPILLKRGMSASIQEFLMSAEYIMAEGNENVILCERGIRTFETFTRNTLDLSAIPIIKKLSHLPVIVDPSHSSGMWWLVEPLSKAAIAVGADGLIIEVHNDPENAKCDGQQSIKPNKFNNIMESLKEIARAVGREI